MDGEAVILGVDGISDFNALHSRKHDDEVQFCAFDILAEGGENLRDPPLSSARPTSLTSWRVDRTAPLLRRSNRARSVPIYFGRLAGWALRDWSRSGGTGRIRLAGRSTGSK